MNSKIYKVRKDLRALKKSSHALKRLIEIRGMHFKRIELLSSMPASQETSALMSQEREIISALRIDQQIKESAELEARYAGAIEALPPHDKAMVLDCFLNGMPYWKLANEYGYSEEGARKHISSIITKIASQM